MNDVTDVWEELPDKHTIIAEAVQRKKIKDALKKVEKFKVNVINMGTWIYNA